MKDFKETREIVFEKEDSYKLLELTNSWIGNMDTKASFLLAYLALVNGFVVSNGVPSIFSELPSIPTGVDIWLKKILAIALYLTLVSSLFLLLGTLTARLKGNKKKTSLLFFGEIASMSLNDYKAKILNRTEEELIKDVLEQIHTNSLICTKKSRYYNVGVRVTFIATVLYVVCMWMRIL